MRLELIFILSILYMIAFFTYAIIEFLSVKKYKRMRIINYVRCMYLLIYGLIPSIMYMYFYMGGSENRYLNRMDFSYNGIYRLYILFLISIIGYISMNIGYIIIPKKSKIKNHSNTLITISAMYKSSIIILIIGFISLLLWTKAYGSPFDIIPYAQFLRSGYSPIYNPFTFMKRFCPLLMLSAYMLFTIINVRPKNKQIIPMYVLFIFSFLWSIVYLLANDGRFGFILFFATLMFIKMEINQDKKDQSQTIKILFKYILFGIIAFILMSLADGIMGYLSTGVYIPSEVNVNIFELLRDELGYVTLSGQMSIYALENKLAGYRVIEEIFSAIFSIVPDSLISYPVTSTFAYNTEIIGNLSGTIPTDLISYSIYNLGVIGVVAIPLLFGIIVRRIQVNIGDKISSPYYLVIYIIAAIYSIKAISHCDSANIILNIFFVMVGHIIVRIRNIKIKYR